LLKKKMRRGASYWLEGKGLRHREGRKTKTIMKERRRKEGGSKKKSTAENQERAPRWRGKV